MKEFVLMLKKTFDFSGKSSRKEYWKAFLFCIIFAVSTAVFALPLIALPSVFETAFYCLMCLYKIIIFLPMLSLTVRRLHDVGKSGWFVLIGLIAFLGEIFLLYWLLQPSNFKVNPWYANYKNNPDNIDLEATEEVKKPSEQNDLLHSENQIPESDSLEKIIDELNEMREENKISQKEYDEILKNITKK